MHLLKENMIKEDINGKYGIVNDKTSTFLETKPFL